MKAGMARQPDARRGFAEIPADRSAAVARGAVMRRVGLAGLVLGAAIGITRLPPMRLSLGSAYLAQAREVGVYRLTSDQPVRFTLAPEQRKLRILVNLDLPKEAADQQPAPLVIRLRIPEDDRDETFPLEAFPALSGEGKPTAFYLGEPVRPSRTRELAVDRDRGDPATVELGLVEPAPGSASVRLLVTAERSPISARMLASKDDERERLAAVAGPLAWDEMGEDLQAELLSRVWVRAAALPGTESRRLYLLDQPRAPPAPRPEPADEIGPGRALAYTLRGPGVLEIEPQDADLTGDAHVLDASGARRRHTVGTRRGERLSVPVPKGLATVRLTARSPAAVRAYASSSKMVVPPAQARRGADGRLGLFPAWTFQRSARLLAGQAPPVAFDVAGRGGSELRLTAAPVCRPGDEQVAAQVTWRALDGGGKVLAEGRWSVESRPAPEDRIDEDPAAVPGQPVVGYLWVPPAADRLELRASHPVDLVAASPGYDADPATSPGLSDGVTLRYAPRERLAWFPIQPAGAGDLARAGRITRIRRAVRLDLVPDRPPPAGPAQGLPPVSIAPRFELIAPGDADDARSLGSWFEVPLDRSISFTVSRPQGGSGRARIAPTLLYSSPPGVVGRPLIISVDDRPGARTPVFASRGKIPLPLLAPGEHDLRVESEGRIKLFLDQRIAGAAVFRNFDVYELRPGREIDVRLTKPAASRSLGVVVYFDGRPPSGARLTAVIDGGQRNTTPGVVFPQRTTLRRAFPLVARPAPTAFYLNRPAGNVHVSDPVFIPLLADLEPGAHRVSVAVTGARSATFVRFFAYGAPIKERFSHMSRLLADEE